MTHAIISLILHLVAASPDLEPRGCVEVTGGKTCAVCKVFKDPPGLVCDVVSSVAGSCKLICEFGTCTLGCKPGTPYVP